MLNLLRDFSKTWVAKILLAVLVVSFGAFGVNNVVTQLGSSTIARVGDVDITSQDFQRAYQAQINAVGQQLGKVPSSAEAMAMNIPQQVISRLAADAVVNKFGETMGVGSSDDHLSQMLQDDPAFQNTVGKFDKSQFQQVLQQNGFSEGQYLAEQAKASRRIQVTQALFADAEGRPWRPDVCTNRFGRLRTRLGLERVRLHDLRHFVATVLTDGGIPIGTVSTRLGHSQLSTTLDLSLIGGGDGVGVSDRRTPCRTSGHRRSTRTGRGTPGST